MDISEFLYHLDFFLNRKKVSSKNWFHIKSQWKKNSSISTLCIDSVTKLPYEWRIIWSKFHSTIWSELSTVARAVIMMWFCWKLRPSNHFKFPVVTWVKSGLLALEWGTVVPPIIFLCSKSTMAKFLCLQWN